MQKNSLMSGLIDRLKKLKSQVERLKKRQEESYEKSQPKLKAPKEERGREMLITFSLSSVAKATLVVIGLWVLYGFVVDVWNILLIFFVAILLAAALDPTVDALEKYRIPRPISVIVIFLILLGILGFFISQLVPLVAVQLLELAKSLSNFLRDLLTNEATNYPFSKTLQPLFEDLLQGVDRDLIVDQVKGSLESLSGQLQSFAGDTFGVIKTLFNGAFNFLLVLFLVFFLVVDDKAFDKFFISLFPSKHGTYVLEKMDAVKDKIGHWLRGQLILMFLMFAISYIVFSILGVDYALTLAMITGLGELIPVIGAFVAGIPAILVAFNESIWLALWVLIALFIMQQLEGNIIVPYVMKKAVGLSPVIVIFAMMIGFATLKLLGVIIAVPVAASLAIFVNDYLAKEK